MVRRNVLAVLAMISTLMLHRQEGQIMARNLAVVREQLNLTFLAQLDTLIFVTGLLLQRRRTRQRDQNNRRRRAWVWPRPQNWFDLQLVSPAMDSLWKPNFRMSRQTFNELCNVLRYDLEKQETRMHRPVSVEKPVAVGLWRLATGNSYRSCGLQFGLARKSTSKVISQQFESILCERKNN